MAKSKKKRKITSVLSILLVLALVVSGTLALYTYYTGGVANKLSFTSGDGIKIAVEEDKWVADDASGLDTADISAGKNIDKNPTFKNISPTLVDVYGALRIAWVKADGTLLTQTEFDTYIAPYITLNELDVGAGSTQYTADAGTLASALEVYYYNSAVAYNASSEPLFTSVKFKSVDELSGGYDANTYLAAQEKWIEWGGFEIIVEGSAVDTVSGTATQAQPSLFDLFPERSAPMFVDPIFGNNSWATIAYVSENDIAPNGLNATQVYEKYGWSLGDEKVIELGEPFNVSQIARIIDFNKDDLTTPNGGVTKAGITMDFKNCVPTLYAMNSTDTNVGSWNESEMRTSSTGGISEIREALPSDLATRLKMVNKITAQTYNGSTNQTSSDDLFLLSVREKFADLSGTSPGANTGYSNYSEFWAQTAYALYAANSTDAFRVQNQGDEGSNVISLLRSPRFDAATQFCNVRLGAGGPAGGANSGYASILAGVAPGFCL